MDNDTGASTRSKKPRPRYRDLLRDAREGRIDTIVAYTSGRLTRRPSEHEGQIELAERHGINFAYVSSPSFDLNTAAGRRVARILAANDAGEAEDIAERVQREVRQRAERGEPHGGPRAFGYTPDGRNIVPAEAEIVMSWYEGILSGRSITGLVRDLNHRGIKTPGGKSWHHSSVRVILLNPRNAGLRLLHGEEFRASWPAIVPEEQWRAVHALLSDPARRTNTGRTARRWLGSGLYNCERCNGLPVHVTYNGGGTGGQLWPVYFCRRGCSRSWKAEPIDEWIDKLVAKRLKRADFADLLPNAAAQADVRQLRADAMAARKRLAQLGAEFAEGELDPAALRVANERLKAKLVECERRLVQVGDSGVLTRLALSGDPAQAWLDTPKDQIDRRQAIIRALMTVTLGTPIRGRAKWEARKFITIHWKTSPEV